MKNELIIDLLPSGVAVLDAAGRFVSINSFGARLLGYADPRELHGVQSPFGTGDEADVAGYDSRADERTAFWDIGQEEYSLLAYRIGGTTADSVAVTFRDVTEQHRQHARVAALARTAANLASQGSMVATVLDAMAREVQGSEGVAGAQLFTVSPLTKQLQIMGSAGFSEPQTFFDLLMAAGRRGATLATYEVLDSGKQIVYPRRKAAMLTDPNWQSLHEYISQLDWEDFVCTPLTVRGEPVGVLNVYMAPGFHAGESMLGFFSAMAEQASLAVDYATLLERDRIAIRREERKRLARDLHDSVVQQVFSIGMQARALQREGAKIPGPWGRNVAAIAHEITELGRAVQRDLRGIVLALQPSISAELGLPAALRLLVDDLARRTDVRFELSVDPAFPQSDVSLVEDVYQVVSEAVHNAVKHAAPATVAISVGLAPDSRAVTVDVVDDGIGPGEPASDSSGYGLTSLRERVARWSGHIEITANASGRGTGVHASLMPARPEGLHDE
ncbi:histidine kinase [Nocardia sp. NPDC004860]|uniref:sensor histidine kinase n=1 Tax=Nocardia sp. NPDC004860 TaxID=3154557 RepID=UPI0033AF5A19